MKKLSFFPALHLLERLLSFNPEDRVTAELALSHPFVQEYSCVADEPVCLKQLHLEHEVDDFLEYTLKDLIVGECVALAEEQPRIHLQMSSCCSLTDITKECNVSPSESTSHSTEDKSLELKTVSEDYHEVIIIIVIIIGYIVLDTFVLIIPVCKYRLKLLAFIITR